MINLPLQNNNNLKQLRNSVYIWLCIAQSLLKILKVVTKAWELQGDLLNWLRLIHGGKNNQRFQILFF